MNASDIFVFLIASLDNPVYLDFIKMRKLIFKKYNIPHMFMFDGEKPHWFEADEHDVFFPLVPGPYPAPVIDNKMNPHMVMKFIKALSMIDINKYKYILRINLSTYINFPKILPMLDLLPKTKVASSRTARIDYIDSRTNEKKYIQICHGMAQIYSPDIACLMRDLDINTPELYIHYDDVVLSIILEQNNIQIIPFPHYYPDYYTEATGRMESDDIFKSYAMIRVKHHDRTHDLTKWRHIIKLNDDIDYP